MAQHKELNEPDEFLEALQRMYRYTMENIKFISLIAGGILAGVIIIIFMLYQIKMNRMEEAGLLNQAVAAYHEGKSEEVLTALNEIAGKTGIMGAMALMYQGNLLFDKGDYEGAIEKYAGARELSERPEFATLRGLALQGIAYAELSLKNFDKAEEALQEIQEPFKDLSLLELGRLYASKGEQERSLHVLDELINDYPDSPWVQAAEALKSEAR